MLVELSVENILSFAERTTFSLLAGKVTKQHKEHVRKTPVGGVVRGCAIFGANAVGKSNLLKVLALVERMMISNSCTCVAGKQFKLGDRVKPEMKFDIRYEYNGHVFRYEITTNGAEVLLERLTLQDADDEMLYERQSNNTVLGERLREYTWYEQRTCRKDSFYLMKLVDDGLRDRRKDIPESKLMIDACWGMKQFIVIDASQSSLIGDKFYAKLQSDDFRKYLVDLLHWADVGISDVVYESVSKNEQERLLTKYSGVIPVDLSDGWSKVVQDDSAYYLLTNENGVKVTVREICCKHGKRAFRASDESQGTIKLIQLSSMLYQIKESKLVWCIDEFDAKFHTVLSQELLKQYMNQAEVSSQLIVAVHDTNLMTHDIWRTDEILLVSKSKDGETDIKRLDSLNPRFDKRLAKGYIHGDYGALPEVGKANEENHG